MKTLNIDLERDREQMIRYLQNMPLRRFTVTVTNRKSRRSLSQNALLWMWIRVIASETGHTDMEIHAYVVQTFSPRTVNEVMGKVITKAKGTSELNMTEFTDLLNHIDAWAAGDLGIILPKPEDQYYLAMGIKHKEVETINE